jgi:hypothetical protein
MKIKKISRFQHGKLFFKAWIRATTSQNGVSGMQVTGIFPLDKSAFPEYAFLSNEVQAPQKNNEN